MAIVLDTSPLSLITHRLGHAEGDAARAWLDDLSRVGCRFFVPEIADYEHRREMLRARNSVAIARLDAFNDAQQGRYLPLTTPAVRLAALLWAQGRQVGRPAADPHALDGDALISAQALMLDPANFGLAGAVVATENPRHLAAYGPPELWTDILP